MARQRDQDAGSDQTDKDQPNQITAMVAARLMFELTSLIADRIAAQTTASPGRR